MADAIADRTTKHETMTLNMGPQHPSTHGVLRLVLELDGETVLRCEPVIGYLHTGIEKSCEDKPYFKVVPLTDRMDYLAPMSNNLVYALAVEKLLELEVPPKAQWVRVMMTELTRISSHLVWLGTHAMDLGAMTVFLYCFRERERINTLYELLSGVRMMSSYFRIGGLADDMPPGFEGEVRSLLDDLPARIDDYEQLLTTNEIFLERTRGVGVLTLQDALDMGVSGPSLRASGVAWDLRKAHPYESYDKFAFEVPTRQDGDVYSRYLVRVQEMRESTKIARQALDGMPSGPWKADAPGYVPPDKKLLETSMEALIYHFKYFTEGFSPPAGDVYQAIESPKGEIGCLLSSDGSPKPRRVHFRGPSFINLQALPKFVEGRLLADVVACIGSIDIVLGEVDR
ncbi:MAG TPA: NADH dehydrogenase (quinone) subunit D [Armatimonadota bacterium]|jgi:NADH-quinone oxidoreductase subunit D